MKTHLTYGVIIGILIAVVGFHGYEVYQIKKATIQNQTVINEIVAFLNKNSAPVEPTPAK